MSTSARSPSRWLAPLALLACAIAVFAIVSGGSSGDSTSGTPSPSRPASTGKQQQSGGKKKKSGASSRTYRVQPGDTLSGIATKTGVPLARIEQLNPALDSQSLQTGQKVKLGP
jgi:LysM repeat protein